MELSTSQSSECVMHCLWNSIELHSLRMIKLKCEQHHCLVSGVVFGSLCMHKMGQRALYLTKGRASTNHSASDNKWLYLNNFSTFSRKLYRRISPEIELVVKQKFSTKFLVISTLFFFSLYPCWFLHIVPLFQIKFQFLSYCFILCWLFIAFSCVGLAWKTVWEQRSSSNCSLLTL